MSFEVAVFIAFGLLITACGVAVSRLARNQQLKREESLLAEARTRGWTFAASDEGVFRLMRWRGTTDGIAWTAEYRRRRHKKKSQHTRTHRLVWWADTLRGPASPLLFMGVPKGKETPAISLAQGEGVIATMAQKAAGYAFEQAVDVYFGEDSGTQVDATSLRSVASGTPPGFIVMAADPAEASRWLADGWTAALSAQERDPDSALSDDHERPWVLLLPRRVALARMRLVQSASDIERMARAGAALVKRT